MKVAFISTFEKSGGAAIAARRLKKALEENYENVEIELIYQNEETYFQKKRNTLRLLCEKIILWFFLKNKKNLFRFSHSIFGINPSKVSAIRNADIVHIHWLNNAFISLKGLNKIQKYGKPIVWTLHDMWAFTGGCHYSGSCENYRSSCDNCFFLNNSKISIIEQEKKKKIYENGNFYFVGCSSWISDLMKNSEIGRNQRVKAIPNPIFNSISQRTERSLLRKEFGFTKRIICFAAAKLTDERKGLNDLLEALLINNDTDNVLVLIGEGFENLKLPSEIEVINFGFINDSDRINSIIKASDVIVCPSVEDNLPNTVMESLSMGTPVIAYNIGGLSDLVEHKENGYLVEFSLRGRGISEGLKWVNEKLSSIDRSEIAGKTFDKFSASRISALYMEVYQEILADKINGKR